MGFCQAVFNWNPISNWKSVGIQLEIGNQAFSNFEFASLYHLVHYSKQQKTHFNWKLEIHWNPVAN